MATTQLELPMAINQNIGNFIKSQFDDKSDLESFFLIIDKFDFSFDQIEIECWIELIGYFKNGDIEEILLYLRDHFDYSCDFYVKLDDLLDSEFDEFELNSFNGIVGQNFTEDFQSWIELIGYFKNGDIEAMESILLDKFYHREE